MRSCFHKLIKPLPFLAILLILALSGCKSKDIVKYGGFGKYRLDKGEVQTSITEGHKQLFDALCEVKGFDLAINRTFDHDFGMFISMGFSMIPPDFYAGIETDSSFVVLEKKDFGGKDVAYRAYLLKKHFNGRDFYICRVIFQEKHFDHLIIYDAILDKEAEVRAWYEDHDRIHQKLSGAKRK